MERLTYRTDNGEYVGMPNYVSTRTALEKLSRLEDLEEELGIDLLTKHKIEQSLDYDGLVYVKKVDDFASVICRNADGLLIDTRHLFDKKKIDKLCLWVNYSAYGRTWALTREEME